jgi:hypothetical protein
MSSPVNRLTRRWSERQTAVVHIEMTFTLPLRRRALSSAVTHLLLVRPIQRLCILLALLLTSCAAPVAVDGRYAATISQANVEELKQRIAGFEGGRYTFIRITAYAPNTVEIGTTQIRGSRTTERTLDAYRRRRGWHVQKRPDPPATRERVKITGDYIPG